MATMSTSTLKGAISRGQAANNVEDAIRILYESEYHHVIIYARKEKDLRDIHDGIYEEIKKRNAEIEDVNKQMLPDYPYRFDAVYECLPMYCSEISMGLFEEQAGLLRLFTRANYNVLTDPEERKPLSSKALTSLAMLGHMVSGN